MKTYEEALITVLESVPRPGTVSLPASASPGYVLAEEVVSDIDMPPFDRSAMDGFAVRGSSLRCSLLPGVFAGDSPGFTVERGQAAPVMTGAPVPSGADRVVMVEQSVTDGDAVEFSSLPGAGDNICRRGEDMREGQTVLSAGTLLAPQHPGIAAMAGREVLTVFRKPRIALVTTGSEVVNPSSRPGPGQVRNANLVLMQCMLETAGFPVAGAFHVRDDPGEMLRVLREAIEDSDFLLVAGGVSRGLRDHVPEVLEAAGVELLFGSVAQKPGKPLHFGISGQGKPVFGLPGNPVSVVVCIEEYAVPALRRASGFPCFRKREFTGRLSCDAGCRPGRMNFIRVNASLRDGVWILSMPATSGSGDLMSTADVNALALADAECTRTGEGESVRFHLGSGYGGELAFA